MKRDDSKRLTKDDFRELMEKGREYRQSLHYFLRPWEFPQFYKPRYYVRRV